MPSTVTENSVTAIVRELWADFAQIPLYKSLVSMEVANTRLEDKLKQGDTFNLQYFGDLSAATYTPGTPVTAQDLAFTMDSLVVSAYKTVTWYVNFIISVPLVVTLIKKLRKLRETLNSFMEKTIRSQTLPAVA